MQYIEHKVGDLVVNQRQSDGYINATKLAKAYELNTGRRKNYSDWFEKDRTHEFLNVLSSKIGIEVEYLVQSRGDSKNKEYWIHPKLAVSFATWLSPEFELMVSEWVEKWLFSGQTPIVEQPQTLHPYQRVWYQRLMLFEQKDEIEEDLDGEIPDEIDEQEWLQAAASNPVFDFLKDPEEDIYTLADGKPFND